MTEVPAHEFFAEKLVWFKENERPETVLLIAEDSQMEKILVAWSSISVKPAEEVSLPEGATESEIWNWLWRNTVYSRDELLAKSTIAEFVLEKKLNALIGNRILYPDGTINTFVQRYLREKVLKLFESSPRKARRKAAK